MQKRTTDSSVNRGALLGLAHMGAKQLGWDEDTRKCMQRQKTGKESLKDMSNNELLDWCWHLKRIGAQIGIPHPPRRGGKSWDRPSGRQLGEIQQLALQFGWTDGLDDSRLNAFVERTTKVENIKFLMRWQATDVISGLRRWLKQIQTKQGMEDL
ncbi:MAG: regulatory protein GemA [Nitrosomonas sp.]|nr:regulatory protein GemA [Nitrosomonas sp.]